MKSKATSKKNAFTRLILLASLFSLSLLNSACSDQSGGDAASQDQQTQDQQTQDQQNQDKKAQNKSDDDQAAKSDDSKENGEVAKKGKKDKKEKAAIPVEVVSVFRGDIPQTYQTITTLEAENDAQVVARSTGILQEIMVEEGDKVKQGQLLAQLDIEQLSLEVAQLEATSKKLKKELTRQESLYKRRLSSSDALDRARFEYQSQLAQYKLSKLKLNYASIKAPIDGVIVERQVKAGNLIRENDILFKIVDPTSLKAILFLPEKEMSRVSKDQPVLLNVDAIGNQIIKGSIERVRPAIDADTGTFRVTAKLIDSDSLLKPGMFGKVEIVFDVHQNSLLVEQQAVITQDNRSHVFVVKENKAIQTPIKLGYKHNGMVEIAEGVSESDLVITTGQQILKHENLIEIVGQEINQISDDLVEQSASVGVATNP